MKDDIVQGLHSSTSKFVARSGPLCVLTGFLLLLALSLLGKAAGCTGGEAKTPEEMYAHARAMEAKGFEREAGHWMQKAAYSGHLTAQVEVGFMYAVGRTGFLRDPHDTEKWFRAEVMRGEPVDRFRLGYAYKLGTSGVLINSSDAARWFNRAAETAMTKARAGDPEALTTLGLLAASGRGAVRDLARAERLWKRAAHGGYAPAQLHLARLFWYRGEHRAARFWLVPAARRGSAAAQFRLSRLYQGGYGIKPDERRAMALLRRAAQSGYGPAQRQLRGMQAQGLASGFAESPGSDEHVGSDV